MDKEIKQMIKDNMLYYEEIVRESLIQRMRDKLSKMIEDRLDGENINE